MVVAAAVAAKKPTARVAKSTARPADTATSVVSTGGRDAAEAGVSRSQNNNRETKDGLQRLCKSRKIIGKKVAPMPAKHAGCGIRKGAIKLYEVNEVKLSTPA